VSTDPILEAPLNYLSSQVDRPVVYAYRAPEATVQQTTEVTRHTMVVRNGRLLLDELSLDGPGVALVDHVSGVSDFYDPDEVRRSYFPEVERLVAEATGATRVYAFDHNVRCAARAKAGEPGVSMPVKFAHNDYTKQSGPQRVRDLLPDEADELLKHRFAVVNVWRPIVGPVQRNPLAVCDAQSIAPDDLVATDLVYRDRTGEVQSLAFNPDHRWLYFPQMRADEVMLLKCFDSADDGRAVFTAHAAFDDPTSPADAEDRESIEVRTIAFFGPPQPGRASP
jgi:hypothetical protein